MYSASALPPSASFCNSLAAAEKFLRRIEVFTPSSGSAGRDTASAVPAARSPRNASARLLRATFGLDRDADALEELRRQHAAGAHDHRIIVDVDRRSIVLDRDALGFDLLDVGFHQHLHLAGAGRALDALPIARLGAIELRAAIR